MKVEYNENDLYDLITQCEEDAKAQATMGTIISESKEKGTYTVETTTGRLPIHKMQEQEQKVEQPAENNKPIDNDTIEVYNTPDIQT